MINCELEIIKLTRGYRATVEIRIDGVVKSTETYEGGKSAALEWLRGAHCRTISRYGSGNVDFSTVLPWRDIHGKKYTEFPEW